MFGASFSERQTHVLHIAGVLLFTVACVVGQSVITLCVIKLH
jgi:hypothetical protein